MLLVGVSHFWWLLKPIQSPTAIPSGEIRLQGICRILTSNIGHQQRIFEIHPEKNSSPIQTWKKKLPKFARLNRFNLQNNKYINPKDSDLFPSSWDWKFGKSSSKVPTLLGDNVSSRVSGIISSNLPITVHNHNLSLHCRQPQHQLHPTKGTTDGGLGAKQYQANHIHTETKTGFSVTPKTGLKPWLLPAKKNREVGNDLQVCSFLW